VSYLNTTCIYEFCVDFFNQKLIFFLILHSGAKKGVVLIGIAKPLPMSDFADRNHSATESFQDELKLRKPDVIMEVPHEVQRN
jgi:hypothetical protein